MIIPLFGLGGNAVIGLNGIQQATQLQQQQQALLQTIRDNARDDLQFQSELDSLSQFANFRQQGLTPDQAFFAQSRGSFNPLTANAGLNNFVATQQQLLPSAIASARSGDPRLLNSIGASTGFQFNANNPTSGIGLLGAEGIGATTRFNIANNATGGQLFNPSVAPLAAPTAIAQGNGVTTTPIPQRIDFTQQQSPAAQTQIQQNSEILRQVQRATQPQQQNNIFADILNNTQSRQPTRNPQRQRLPAVESPPTRFARATGRNSFSDSLGFNRGGTLSAFSF